MKGFIDDIIRVLGLPEPSPYKYIVVGGEAIFLQGIRHIKSYTSEMVEIALRRGGVLTVCGEELIIAELNAEEMVIKGRITKIERG